MINYKIGELVQIILFIIMLVLIYNSTYQMKFKETFYISTSPKKKVSEKEYKLVRAWNDIKRVPPYPVKSALDNGYEYITNKQDCSDSAKTIKIQRQNINEELKYVTEAIEMNVDIYPRGCIYTNSTKFPNTPNGLIFNTHKKPNPTNDIKTKFHLILFKKKLKPATSKVGATKELTKTTTKPEVGGLRKCTPEQKKALGSCLNGGECVVVKSDCSVSNAPSEKPICQCADPSSDKCFYGKRCENAIMCNTETLGFKTKSCSPFIRKGRSSFKAQSVCSAKKKKSYCQYLFKTTSPPGGGLSKCTPEQKKALGSCLNGGECVVVKSDCSVSNSPSDKPICQCADPSSDKCFYGKRCENAIMCNTETLGFKTKSCRPFIRTGRSSVKAQSVCNAEGKKSYCQ